MTEPYLHAPDPSKLLIQQSMASFPMEALTYEWHACEVVPSCPDSQRLVPPLVTFIDGGRQLVLCSSCVRGLRGGVACSRADLTARPI